MSHLYENRIFSPEGSILRTSRNLRGMCDYARISPVTVINSRRDPANMAGGILHVMYADGCYSIASFASYHIMIDFVRNKRSWSNATHNLQNEDVGYLTKPGIIGGTK